MALPPAPPVGTPSALPPSSPLEPLRDHPDTERFRRWSKLILAIQAIGVVVAAVLTIPALGARGDPLYVPLAFCLVILVAGGILITLEGFVFRHKEIGYLNSDSRRFLLAHFSFKDGIFMGIVGLVVGIILVLPLAQTALEDLSAQQRQWTHARNDAVTSLCVRFLSDDWLGLSHISIIYAEPEALDPQAPSPKISVYVFFLDPGDKTEECPDPAKDQPTIQITDVTPDKPARMQVTFKQLTMVKVRMQTTLDTAVKVTHGFKVQIYWIVLPLIGFLVLLYGALNLAFAGSMVPVKKKYEKGSMYQDLR